MNLNTLHNIYEKSLNEKKRNINFWEEYLRNLNALDLKDLSNKLTVPVLVPIGNKVLFRGELKHTNEITVALGGDYFAKCSTLQAEELRQHRIKDATLKLETLIKEKEFLESHLLFSKQNLTEDAGHDIIEVFTEEQDMIWRKQHKERVRQYKQKNVKNDESPTINMTDEEIWNRLEELELQEEMKNELSSDECIVQIEEDKKPSISDAKANYLDSDDDDEEDNDGDDDDNNEDDGGDDNDSNDDDDDKSNNHQNRNVAYNSKEEVNKVAEIFEERLDNEVYVVRENSIREFMPKQSPKLVLLDQIIERHNYIMEALAQLIQEERMRCKTDDDLIERLNAMEQVEEYEDEAVRLEGLIDDALDDGDDESNPNYKAKPKKLVSFADDEGNVVLELTFKHSDIEPLNKPYDPKKGIIKPSDIYEAFSNPVSSETTSILKKTNYVAPKVIPESEGFVNKTDVENEVEVLDTNIKRIVVKDVTEKVDHNDNNLENKGRPMSLFKKRRQEKLKH